MFQITVPAKELWDENKGEFIEIEETVLKMEHSLVSISKWESYWCKPFLSREEKTREEIIDYIRFMTTTPDVDPIIYTCLSNENIEQINKYIEAPMTATYISEAKSGRPSREQITSELIYYWMIALNIPFECQNWHINRLLTLIRVCNIKNQPQKKMSRREIASRNAALNAERRKRLNTKG